MYPNFLVAGVAKCGTTSLFYYLIQHPEICIPKKETFYFIRSEYNIPPSDKIGQRDPSQLILTREKYDDLYSKCSTKAVGEVSTCYFHYPEIAIPEIKSNLGDPKIIIILRNPVERAWSNYRHFTRLGREPLSFTESLDAEEQRIANHWDFMRKYKSMGFYSDYLEKYKSEFSFVHVMFNDDLEEHPVKTMQELFRFLEIDDSFIPDTKTRYNISDSQQHNFWFKYFLKNNLIRKTVRPLALKLVSPVTRQKIRHKLKKSNRNLNTGLSIEMRNKLIDLYSEDINKLESLTERDLSDWLK